MIPRLQTDRAKKKKKSLEEILLGVHGLTLFPGNSKRSGGSHFCFFVLFLFQEFKKKKKKERQHYPK